MSSEPITLPAPAASPLREMFAIAGPTVATMTSYTVMTFTDKWVVSHIGPEPIYVGAQGNGGLASWVPISLCHGMLTIINTFVAQNMGAGKADRGPAYAWNGLWMGLIYWLVVLVPLGFVLPAVFRASEMDPRQAELATQYGQVLLWGACFTMVARCMGQFFFGMHKATIIMVAGIAANIFNLFVSMVLTFGNGPVPEMGGNWLGTIMQPFAHAAHAVASALGIAPMGIMGSAIGTVLATMLEGAIPFVVFLSAKMHAQFRTRTQWRWSAQHVKDIFRLGWPGGAMFGNEMICWAFFMVYLVSHFGAEHSTAGWIAHQYMSLSFMPAVGLSVATTALVGKYQGMGRSDLATHRAWLATRIALIYMGACGLIFFFFRHQLIDFFVAPGTPPEVRERIIALGATFLIATAAFQLFDAVAMVLSGALRGAGDTVVPGVATVALSWLVIVLGGLALVKFTPHLESLGPWIAAASYIALLCLFLLGRFLTGHWKSIKVVREE